MSETAKTVCHVESNVLMYTGIPQFDFRIHFLRLLIRGTSRWDNVNKMSFLVNKVQIDLDKNEELQNSIGPFKLFIQSWKKCTHGGIQLATQLRQNIIQSYQIIKEINCFRRYSDIVKDWSSALHTMSCNTQRMSDLLAELLGDLKILLTRQ